MANQPAAVATSLVAATPAATTAATATLALMALTFSALNSAAAGRDTAAANPDCTVFRLLLLLVET